jgi:phage tail protein X
VSVVADTVAEIEGEHVTMSASERQILLSRWIQPSSTDEKVQQDRAGRMVADAVSVHPVFAGSTVKTYTKGSYPNNTNVRRDSDVDVVVEMHDLAYWGFNSNVDDKSAQGNPYKGDWTPDRWRSEVVRAMVSVFGASDVDTSGKIAINIKAVPGSRPSADVVPSFLYYRYNDANRSQKLADQGSCVFPQGSTTKVVNWPQQQLDMGKAKNSATGGRYKYYARALKNAENTLANDGLIDELPSYLMECLAFNVPDGVLTRGTLDTGFRDTLSHMWASLTDGTADQTWVEPNWQKYLFRDTQQKWAIEDGKVLVRATWNYLGYAS